MENKNHRRPSLGDLILAVGGGAAVAAVANLLENPPKIPSTKKNPSKSKKYGDI